MNARQFFNEHGGYDHFVPVFEELARRVGQSLETVELVWDKNQNKYRWCYECFSWTPEEEEKFAEWLVEYFYENRRKFQAGYLSKKHIREHEVPFWLLMYSWRYKYE